MSMCLCVHDVCAGSQRCVLEALCRLSGDMQLLADLFAAFDCDKVRCLLFVLVSFVFFNFFVCVRVCMCLFLII